MKLIDFNKLLQTHWDWQQGNLSSMTKSGDGVCFHFSTIVSDFFNLAEPLVENPNEVDLKKIEKEFKDNDRNSSFYLTEEKQKQGFVEYLVRNGYTFEGTDTWMILDKESYKEEIQKSDVVSVTNENFSDYDKILSSAFSDFGGIKRYLEICNDTITGGSSSLKFDDFRSEIFLIYDNNEPASGGAMFSSVKGNFAYLHAAGTLDKFRGHGYQTDLIKFRVNKALENGITRIYSLVEQGSQSWKNMIKNGFYQAHVANIFAKKATL